jgi:hypothetical protein
MGAGYDKILDTPRQTPRGRERFRIREYENLLYSTEKNFENEVIPTLDHDDLWSSRKGQLYDFIANFLSEFDGPIVRMALLARFLGASHNLNRFDNLTSL